MDKKKIFILINSLWAWWAERVIINLAEKLSKNYIVDIITLKDDCFFVIPEWVNYFPLSKVKNNFLMVLFFPYFLIKFRNILKNNYYDNWFSSLEISNFINIIINKKAIICLEISLTFFKWFIWRLYFLLIKVFYPKAYKIKVNSFENYYMTSDLLNIDKSKFEVIYNPVDLEKISILKKEKIDNKLLELIQNKKVFITVWRLVWQKNHKEILKSLEKIDKNYIYIIIWDWPERNNLEKLSKSLWLSNNILFLWEQKNIFKYLNIWDYFLYSSLIEWFPNVLWEAIAVWIPIITSNFKTWAEEIIMWEFKGNIKKYPIIWKNWVLLSENNFKNDFHSIYNNLTSIKQNASILNDLKINIITDKWIKILEL